MLLLLLPLQAMGVMRGCESVAQLVSFGILALQSPVCHYDRYFLAISAFSGLGVMLPVYCIRVWV